MPQITQRVFHALGFDFLSNESIPFPPTPLQTQRFRFLRILIGCIWLYDTWNFSSGATKHAIAQFLGLPFSSLLVHLAGTAVMFVGLYLALALISGKGMRSALWVGTVFLAIMWIWVERGGDFNPATGGTDAGIAPPYFIALILTYLTWRIGQPFAPSGESDTLHTTRVWLDAARVMFGFLWAWDAFFKLHPYFITHMASFISGAEAGQPAWIVAYQQAWVALITHTSPLFFGIATALTEVALAWSLLSGKLLRVFLPLGFAYTLMIWSTAEGFGGPYGNGRTGMPGNMLGNTIIYALIFAYFIVIYAQGSRRKNSV